ncbi:MAG: lipid-A-disaccharide synthase N-terminal domain-containing protein, partial [Hyphomicrobiaceae bacterium]
MEAALAKIAAWWATTPTTEIIWLSLGFVAQLMFASRFIVQWIASEKARRSIVPETFWYFSFAGGAL